MIPIKLTMRNFMPYRENVPTLDFTGIHLVSICGDNGNGKSAIIDAMTWALWGETRAKRDDDLIHQNANETEVEFEFAVGEQKYRIIRKHARPKRKGTSGQTSLSFQIAGENGFRPLDGDSIPQTQQKIIDMLHMDYGTFTNSAFLRQGHADEFTTSNPAKRKQVLANILGLTDYDGFENQAKDIVRQREMLRAQLMVSIADINRELETKAAGEEELQKAQIELEVTDKFLKEQETILNSLRQQKELLESKRAHLLQLEKNIAERTRTLTQWQEHIRQLNTRIAEHEAVMAQRAGIEEGYRKLTETKTLNDTLNKNLALVNKLSQRRHELEMFVERESQTLTKEHALLQSKVTELEKTFQELPQLKAEASQAQNQLQGLAAAEETLHCKKEASQDTIAQIRSLEADKSRLEKESAEIDEKLNLLLRQPGNARCPVCQTELGAAGLEHISTHYNAEKQGKSDALQHIAAEIEQKKASAKITETEIAQAEKTLAKEKAQAQGRYGAVEREISRAEEAGRQLTDIREDLKQVEERLARKDFATAQQEAAAQIIAELAALQYDAQKHEEARLELVNLQKYEGPKQRLAEADRLIEQEREDRGRAEKSAVELQENLKNDNQQKQELTQETAALPQVAGSLQRADTEVKKLTAGQKQIQEKIGMIKGKLEYYSRRELEKSEKETQLNSAVKEAAIYHELAEAFGKKGIQALLIETALPEIENEANKLLAKMTENRMHVKIETQKETQKGEVAETLEIKISDELGTRNYEMYSGGEAFRINFAIRIALSRMLARRAGAPLPTLIIDEGFGTQDASGIEKLKEAINSIQDDFEKILVITHVEELRDAFPARIDVVKTAEGSTISLN
ncbi:MAG: SMC family ATPase [Dehalococcoidales bacterium]|jgi:DNA repair protein SbcC/Rad50